MKDLVYFLLVLTKKSIIPLTFSTSLSYPVVLERREWLALRLFAFHRSNVQIHTQFCERGVYKYLTILPVHPLSYHPSLLQRSPFGPSQVFVFMTVHYRYTCSEELAGHKHILKSINFLYDHDYLYLCY